MNDHTTPAVTVHPLPSCWRHAAAQVIARGMRDNPLHVAAYGTQPRRRVRQHSVLIGGLLRTCPTLELTGVFRDGTLVAVAAAAAPGTCQVTGLQRLRMLPVLARLGPSCAARVLTWTAAWSRHDPAHPHAHLGPVAVDLGHQRQGLGTMLLHHHCRVLDQAQHVGYLETDKPENLAFYQRFGYHVVAAEPVLGIPNWFLQRVPSKRAG